MSLTRRLSLLAGSSLVAAFAFAGLAFAPDAALAANECAPVGVSPSANGAAADTYACSGAYASGITYVSNGALTVNGTGIINVNAIGANLTGGGSDSLTFTMTGSLNGSSGPVLDINSASGAINVATAGVAGTGVNVTYGIHAVSTGGGAITISNLNGNINANSNAVGAQQQSAIRAVSTGGNGAVSVTTAGTVTGRLRGIEAQASGTGTLTISTTGSVSVNTGAVGVAAIDARTGSGLLDININTGGASAINGQAGAAILTNAGGNADIDIAAGRIVQAGTSSTAVMDLTAVGESRIDNAGAIEAGAIALAAIRAGGGSFLLNNDGTVRGRLNLGAVTGAVTLNNGASATWTTSGITTFGAGASILNNEGVIFATDVTTFSALDQFNNSGAIYMGGVRNQTGGDSSDGAPDDMLMLAGGVFTGSGGSHIVIDANLGTGGSQAGCTTPTVADCVNFIGASTAGSTLLTIRDSSLSVDGGTLGVAITLIEGSTSEAAFSLDPASDYYSETPQGPAVRKPLVAYRLAYDDANQQHVLVGAITDEAYQVATYASAAQETWRSTAGSWLTRQADLRATPGGLQASRGVWTKVGAQTGERDVAATYDVAGLTFDYDLSHKQKIAHLVFGADLVGGTGWVAGGMVGFVRSDVEYDAAPAEAVSTGFTGGLYGSYAAGPLFVDALVNLNMLHVKADAPQMGLGLDVPMAFDLKSLGGQVEAGWRFGTGSGVFVEPLVGVTYVRTKFDDAAVPGGAGVFDFDDSYASLRIGGGARMGLDGEMMGLAASYSLTGRYWNESEAEAGVLVVTAGGSSALVSDDFGGGFGEIAGSVNLYSDDGGLSGFVNLGGKFADSYSSVDGAAGVRVRW